MGQNMNPTSSSSSDPRAAAARHEGLDLLESRLWEGARRNLRLLYNGGRIAPVCAQTPNAGVGPLGGANTKI